MIEISFIRDDLEEEKRKQMELEDGTSVEELLNSESIEPEEVLVAVNGTIVPEKTQLEDGDQIKVMDVIAGG